MDNPAPPGLARDILNAVGANILAYLLTLLVGMISGFVIMAFPMGIFGVHCTLIALYAWLQIRKGLMRRAILAGVFALTVVLFVLSQLQIA